MQLERVKIYHPESDQHFLNINEKDFDPEKHRLWPELVNDAIEMNKQTLLNQLTRLHDDEGWDAVKAYAETLVPPFEKPKNMSWKESIPMIVEVVYGTAIDDTSSSHP